MRMANIFTSILDRKASSFGQLLNNEHWAYCDTSAISANAWATLSLIFYFFLIKDVFIIRIQLNIFYNPFMVLTWLIMMWLMMLIWIWKCRLLMPMMQHWRRREAVLVCLRGWDGIELLALLGVHVVLISWIGHRIISYLDAFKELLVHLLLLQAASDLRCWSFIRRFGWSCCCSSSSAAFACLLYLLEDLMEWEHVVFRVLYVIWSIYALFGPLTHIWSLT